MISNLRPITPVDEFEQACIKAKLNNKEQKIIDHIRYVGVFTQPSLTKDLKLDSNFEQSSDLDSGVYGEKNKIRFRTLELEFSDPEL